MATGQPKRANVLRNIVAAYDFVFEDLPEGKSRALRHYSFLHQRMLIVGDNQLSELLGRGLTH